MTVPNSRETINDAIVAEMRRAGDEMAREANYDLHTLCEHLREAERQHPECLAATFSPPRTQE